MHSPHEAHGWHAQATCMVHRVCGRRYACARTYDLLPLACLAPVQMLLRFCREPRHLYNLDAHLHSAKV